MTRNHLRDLEAKVRGANLTLHEAKMLPPGRTRSSVERGARLDLREAQEDIWNERAFDQFVREQREANDGELPLAVGKVIRERQNGRVVGR